MFPFLEFTFRRRAILAGLAIVLFSLTGAGAGWLGLVDPFAAAVLTGAGVAAGLAVAWILVRPIERSLIAMAGAMGPTPDQARPLPALGRCDAIGAVARACSDCRDTTMEVARLKAENDRVKAEAQQQRSRDLVKSLNGIIGASVQNSEAMICLGHMKAEIDGCNERAQGMAAAVEELVASIKEISASTSDAATQSQTVETAAASGARSTKDAVSSMEQTLTSVGNTAAEVDRLAQASGEIGEIITQINDIAARTNLLALNATIEAARAGESGKGFAVVAAEVKQLANQSARAADDIGARITGLTDRMNGIQKTMSEGATAVDEGRRRIDGLGGQLEDVSSKVSAVTGRMAEIAAILTQQDSAANDISSGTSSVAELTGRNSEAIKKLLRDMNRIAGELDGQIGAFEVLGDAAIIEIAKNDHIAFKRRVVDVVLGLNNLRPDQLSSHRDCRLGKWAQSVQDERLVGHPAFKELAAPHERVHRVGHEILQAMADGDTRRATAALDGLSEASADVLRCLDALVEHLSSTEAAERDAA